ncbi:erythromycin esterase family protein [Kineococcus arenarius]|uniref:erythromycin esterase family protein n=1 Tax=Kineococcus sp. SYSU DK007 TaxID=3383128 RepID=UPI003D7EF416
MTNGTNGLTRALTTAADLDPLLERVGEARYVLIGEASHGTSEYYTWRAELTRRLLTEKGFSFVAAEADWPDAYRVNCSVVGDTDQDPRDALAGFTRWPTWMWANEEVADFTRWLRGWNATRPRDERVGFYGLDVYSLWDSLRAVLGHLEEHEPDRADAAREAFRCFEPYKEDPHDYAWATLVPTSCEQEVVRLLRQLSERSDPGPPGAREAGFNAAQNAAVVVGAERYYRSVVRGDSESWNVRDTHMADTLDRLVEHTGARLGRPAKAVVWEHNTHVGDARATDMAGQGMVNVGQLVRERHAEDGVVIVGFGGHAGSVVAGRSWGAPMERLPVPPARTGSVEALLRLAVDEPALIVVPPEEQQPGWMSEERPHRAIGVVYHPEAEHWGNYVPTVLGRRYDAFLFFPDTTALHPLSPPWEAGRTRGADTWPVGV